LGWISLGFPREETSQEQFWASWGKLSSWGSKSLTVIQPSPPPTFFLRPTHPSSQQISPAHIQPAFICLSSNPQPQLEPFCPSSSEVVLRMYYPQTMHRHPPRFPN
uniref:Uncharacterized protein n=1 Tax=Dromaius novaehollandiae TaxID=8790 RepID=A0A8C4J3X1_DRONO